MTTGPESENAMTDQTPGATVPEETTATLAPARADDHGGRHQPHIPHLVFGLLYATILGLMAAVEFAGLSGHNLRYLVPLPFILAGGAGLAGLVLNARRRPA